MAYHMTKWVPTLTAKTSGKNVAATSKTLLVTKVVADDIFAPVPPPPKTYDWQSKPTSNIGVFSILPSELRIKIYEYAVLEEDGNDVLVKTTPCTCSRGRCHHGRTADILPGILTTCRQIRYEAGAIFFKQNTGFTFDYNVIANSCAPNYLRAMGAGADLAKEFKFELDIPVFDVASGEFTNFADYVFTIVPPNGPDGEFTLSQSSAYEEALGKICQCEWEEVVKVLNHYKQVKSVGENLSGALNHEYFRTIISAMRMAREERCCQHCGRTCFHSDSE